MLLMNTIAKITIVPTITIAISKITKPLPSPSLRAPDSSGDPDPHSSSAIYLDDGRVLVT